MGSHRDKEVIWIAFSYSPSTTTYLKKFVTARWSQSQKCWYCTDTVAYRQLFGIPEKLIGDKALQQINTVNANAYRKYRETLIVKAYSPATLKTYLSEFAQLLFILKAHAVDELTPERLRAYFYYCHQKIKLSENQVHSRMNAIKFYFEQVLHQPKMFLDIPRPQKPSLLPKALTRKDIEKMLTATQNIKHRLILKLCYGMGLRVSEVVKLKPEDINSESLLVRISGAKGKKDRYVNLPASVLEELRSYYLQYKPGVFLFEGQFGGAYHLRSAQAVFKNAMQAAGIKKQVGIHSLRHSYATHLLEAGTDISFIQKLLEHNNSKTTLRYAQVANTSLAAVKSPLDVLFG